MLPSLPLSPIVTIVPGSIEAYRNGARHFSISFIDAIAFGEPTPLDNRVLICRTNDDNKLDQCSDRMVFHGGDLPLLIEALQETQQALAKLKQAREQNDGEEQASGNNGEKQALVEQEPVISEDAIFPPFNFDVNLEQYLGRKVRLQNGEISTITTLYPDCVGDSDSEVFETNVGREYYANGRYYAGKISAFDIVEVLPKTQDQ